MNNLVDQLVRFSFSGAANTTVGYGVMFSLMCLGISPYYSNAIGYTIGLIMSFLLNRNFVFTAEGNKAHQAGRFIVTFGLSYSFNFITLYFCLLTGMRATWSQIAAGIVYSLTMFLLSRTWVFKQ